MSALSLSPPFPTMFSQQSNVKHNTVEHMTAFEIVQHINSFERYTYTVTEVKVTEVNTKYLLEVFVGPLNADPFSKEGQLRVEIKVFGTLEEADQYMDENY